MDHPDVALILLHVANAARLYLEERDCIPLFAYQMRTPDELTRVVVDEVISSDKSHDQMRRFRSYLRKNASDLELRAVALVVDSRWNQDAGESDTTCIRVEIDHRYIEPLVWQLDYQRTAEGYRFGDENEGGTLIPGSRFAFDP